MSCKCFFQVKEFFQIVFGILSQCFIKFLLYLLCSFIPTDFFCYQLASFYTTFIMQVFGNFLSLGSLDWPQALLVCKHVFLHMFKWDHNDNIGHRPPPFSFHMGDCTHFHKVHQFSFLFEKLNICCTYHCHYVFFELSLVLIGGISSNSFHMFFFSPFKVSIRVSSFECGGLHSFVM